MKADNVLLVLVVSEAVSSPHPVFTTSSDELYSDLRYKTLLEIVFCFD